MNVLLITAELHPYGPPTRVAEDCHALAKALRGLGHRVTVLSPLLDRSRVKQEALARRLETKKIPLGSETLNVTLYDGRTASGVELIFFEQDKLFANPNDAGFRFEGPESVLLAQRVGCLAQVALEIIRHEPQAWDVIHAHDWPTAATLVLLKQEASEIALRTVFTFYDLAEQGLLSRSLAEQLGPWASAAAETLEFLGHFHLLKAGLCSAQKVVTLCSSYMDRFLSGGIDPDLYAKVQQRAPDFRGILHGIDTSTWNAATDSHLSTRFDPLSFAGKTTCKLSLQREFALPARANTPVFAFVPESTATGRHGMDTFITLSSTLLRQDVQWMLLHAEGDSFVEEQLRPLLTTWPDKLAIQPVNAALLHRVISGADIVWVPTRNEPGGNLARIAHRYGTLPVAQRLAMVNDSVVDCDMQLQTGTGFLYDEPTHEQVGAACERALAAYHRGEAFETLRRKVMRTDHSWERSSRLYERLYLSLAERSDAAEASVSL